MHWMLFPQSIIIQCISNALDGSEDDALWEEPVEAEQLGSDYSKSEHSRAEDMCEG